MYDLVTLGACNVDIFFSGRASDASVELDGRERITAEGIDELLHRLARLGCEPVTVCGGGQAANVAAVASRFGLSVGLVCRVGQDSLAETALQDLRNVDLSYVKRSGRTTRAVVIVETNGQRTIMLDSGVDEVLPECAPEIRARHFHFTSTTHPRDLEKEMAWIGELRKQATTSVDGGALYASLGGLALNKLYAGATVVFATEEELATLSGESPEEGAPWLFERGVEVICVKKGAEGASVLTRRGEVFTESAPTADVVDTTGAGDAFAGAFLASHLKGRSLNVSLAEAVKYASATVTNWGRAGLPAAR